MPSEEIHFVVYIFYSILVHFNNDMDLEETKGKYLKKNVRHAMHMHFVGG